VTVRRPNVVFRRRAFINKQDAIAVALQWPEQMPWMKGCSIVIEPLFEGGDKHEVGDGES
jgi:hypothetical protein